MLMPTNEYTTQTMFDQAAEHLLKQNAVAKVESDGGNYYFKSERCMYRAPDGKKCAIGGCIPPDEYKEEFEGESFIRLQGRGLFSRVSSHVGKDLQGIHDAEPVSFWKEELEKLAEKYNLKVNF